MKDAGPSYFINGFAIRPHPSAPIYDNPEKAQLYFQQIITELSSSTFKLNDEIRNILRQTCFVSLWFYLNLLGITGPYDKLKDAISISMCNFRQSDSYMLSGSRAASFMPRGFFKSSVFTTGGGTWELLRDPDETILIANAISGKAEEFARDVIANFVSNPITLELFPEYVPSSSKGKVTQELLILPNRVRHHTQPSIKAIGITGAAEGGHFSLVLLDDLVGLDAIDQNHASTAVMQTAKKWLSTNQNALLIDNTSRIGLAATRYALDDCYSDIYKSCRSVTGWTKGDLQPVEGGIWDIYYRLVEEDGFYLRPDVMDATKLTKLLIDDPWTAQTQYYNSPEKTGLAEFVSMPVNTCSLSWDEKTKDYWIVRHTDENFDDTGVNAVKLSDCGVVLSTDLAATDSGITAKTCRSSLGVWATDANDNKYRIWSRVGYLSIFEVMDAIFEAHTVFGGVISQTIIEANAFQKIVKPLLDKEQSIRNIYINPIPINAAGDKKARIRSCLGIYLVRQKVYVTLDSGKEFLEELRIFPMSDKKLDVLDESEKGITFSGRPETSEERMEREDYEEERENQVALSVFGY